MIAPTAFNNYIFSWTCARKSPARCTFSGRFLCVVRCACISGPLYFFHNSSYSSSWGKPAAGTMVGAGQFEASPPSKQLVRVNSQLNHSCQRGGCASCETNKKKTKEESLGSLHESTNFRNCFACQDLAETEVPSGFNHITLLRSVIQTQTDRSRWMKKKKSRLFSQFADRTVDSPSTCCLLHPPFLHDNCLI